MIASDPALPGSTRYTSTWHRLDGPMGRLIEGSPANGVRVHKWNVWEALRRCPPARHRGGQGCRQCPLREPCLAKAAEVRAAGDLAPQTLDGRPLDLPH